MICHVRVLPGPPTMPPVRSVIIIIKAEGALCDATAIYCERQWEYFVYRARLTRRARNLAGGGLGGDADSGLSEGRLSHLHLLKLQRGNTAWEATHNGSHLPRPQSVHCRLCSPSLGDAVMLP